MTSPSLRHRTEIASPPARRLDARQELDLARLAHSTVDTSRTRTQLAYLLYCRDAFDEAIALLIGAPDPGFAEKMLLCRALLAFATGEANVRARAVALEAFALAEHDTARGAALAEAGKAARRLGLESARDTLTRALALDPHNPDAFKRLAACHLAAGEPGLLVDLIDRLAARGVGHARLLACRTLALAQCGDLAAARSNDGLAAFFHRTELAPPPGWPDAQSFNADLAAQLIAHPALRYEGHGTAARESWRIDTPMAPSAPLVAVLLDQIRDAVASHIDRIAQHDHPWLSARPATARIRSSCVLAEATGFEAWHMHQSGWMSGVYYVQVPDGIVQGSDDAGCIAWGLPEDVAGAPLAHAFGTTVARPAPGTLMLFPSHVHHRTYPHGLGGKRICFAFDIEPC